MGKDPAFLFYPNDWLGGTMTFTRQHKGAYMDLLMAQFNEGHLALQDIRHVLGSDFETMWESKLKCKFSQDSAGKFFNERLEEEVIKRKNFTESRKNNLSKNPTHKETHMDDHMENRNRNRNKDDNGNGNKRPAWAENFKEYDPTLTYPFEYPQFAEAWDAWYEFRRKAKIKKYAEPQAALINLDELSGHNMTVAINIIKQSIKQNWQGLFALKQDGKHINKSFDPAVIMDEVEAARIEITGKPSSYRTPQG